MCASHLFLLSTHKQLAAANRNRVTNTCSRVRIADWIHSLDPIGASVCLVLEGKFTGVGANIDDGGAGSGGWAITAEIGDTEKKSRTWSN